MAIRVSSGSHGDDLEAHAEHHQGSPDTQAAGTVGVEVPPKDGQDTGYNHGAVNQDVSTFLGPGIPRRKKPLLEAGFRGPWQLD